MEDIMPKLIGSVPTTQTQLLGLQHDPAPIEMLRSLGVCRLVGWTSPPLKSPPVSDVLEPAQIMLCISLQ